MRAAISTRHRYNLAERNKGKNFAATVSRTVGIEFATVSLLPTIRPGIEINLDKQQLEDLRDVLSEVLEDWK